ncbi:ABC transporter permease subunit [Actinomadura syzygii]|uniref:ABC transporter permease subunit n=1 Tax=Actinomadura syzygii TaxID=1427538 RepID=A0A5D0ULZ0_9ACTN|nr:ABC transporter permease subunit [Actinomadura syzygii]TYC18846.1 ABC transporter permease subunit [Actinomadura syzygii]
MRGVEGGGTSGPAGGGLKGAAAAEWVRLVHSGSTWWGLGVSGALALGVAALTARVAPGDEEPATVADAVSGTLFGQLILLVLAVLAMTSEHRSGTIRLAFQAIQGRWQVVAAKAAVLGGAGGAVGLVYGFAAVGLGSLLAPAGLDLAPDTATEWRQVASLGLIYAVTAVIGVAIGTLVRTSAGGVSAALVWILVLESAVGLVPRVGDAMARWMPFSVLVSLTDSAKIDKPFGAVGAAVYCSAVAVAVLALALAVVRKRKL